jgi:hypothetical protein
MSEARTEVGNQPALRQIVSEDALRVFSIVKSAGGFRFVEETHVHEPSGPGHDSYWYWEITHESGVYETEQDAFLDAGKSLSWLNNSN